MSPYDKSRGIPGSHADAFLRLDSLHRAENLDEVADNDVQEAREFLEQCVDAFQGKHGTISFRKILHG